ncbi:MAG: hypothetical protein HY554_16875 [Elusimicrobia bacterium]|nr:hypothetical protein [Elusimicrobiota bacterium]
MRRVAAFAAALSWAAAFGCRRGPPSPAAGTPPRLAALEEVLRAKDDNNPRLDRDFDGLTAEEKRLFRERYRALSPESRNERGTVVYLLGRNLSVPEDLDFLREVASEAPCLSLADCSRASSGSESSDEVTLAYPSLVALRQARLVLEAPPSGALAEAARQVIAAGRTSRAPVVARMAARIEP